MIGDIIKTIILYRLATSPTTIIIATVSICALLLLAGAFVRFKNGIFSWICYFAVLAVPLAYTLLTISSIVYPEEDLQLSTMTTISYSDITKDGIVVKKGFRRQVTLPLLGLNQVQTQERLDDVKEFIKSNNPDNTISYKTSKVYEGIILYDDNDIDLNNLMIRNGYVSVKDKAPVQYFQALESAKRHRVGIWATVITGDSIPMHTCLSYCLIAMGICIFVSHSIICRHGNSNISSNSAEKTRS